MKVVYQRIVSDEGSSFVFLDKKARYFRGAYHFHPEYEITMITAGRGMRVVGDSLAEFAPGDLVLLGSNLPHQYMSDATGPAGARAFVIQFAREFLGRALTDTPELSAVARFLNDAARGFVFGAETARQAAAILKATRPRQGLARLLGLLELLRLLEAAPDKRPLCPAAYAPDVDTHESQRVNRALSHIHQNYDKPITLADLAAQMKVSRATCNRLFRKSVGQSCKSFLIKVRLSHACRMLLQTDRSIIDISGRCGFANLSNFNRQFKALKGESPRDFRKKSQDASSR